MTKYCNTCTKTGYLGERVEMNGVGSHQVKGERIKVFQCPVCDAIKAETLHQNGLSTTRTLTTKEVAELPRQGSGLLLALIVLGVVATISKS